MPYFAEEFDVKKSKAERERSALEHSLLKNEEERQLSREKPSKIRQWIWYPIIALITASLPLWLHYNLEEVSVVEGKLCIFTIIVSLVLVLSYVKEENSYKPRLARIRGSAVAIEIFRSGKLSNRETRLEQIHTKTMTVAGLEAACYSVFINNAKFLAQFTIAYCYFLKYSELNSSYIHAICLSAFLILCFFSQKNLKRSNSLKKRRNI